MENRTVSRWINQFEKKNRTVSLWINQFEDVPCQRVRERDKPVKQKNRRRTVSRFIEKRDKRALEKFCYTSNGEMSDNNVFFDEIQKVTDYIFYKV